MSRQAVDSVYPVFTGVWTNWSGGRGSTLTLSQRNGTVLTAFIALYLAFVSGLFWRIICLTLHHWFSSPSKHRDGLYHQKQAILRNSPGAATGLWSFTQILWAWRRQRSRPYIRVLPLLVLCLAFWALLSAASIFSSRITSMMGDEVILTSPLCGRSYAELDGQDLQGQPYYRYKYLTAIDRIKASYDLARNCYTRNDDAGCGVFVKRRIPLYVTTNASCPFDQSLCKSQDRNVKVDIRLDSHNDLGLNTPLAERVVLHWSSQCAPLQTTQYKSVYNESQVQPYRRYSYGQRVNPGRRTIITNSTQGTAISKIRNFSQWKAEIGTSTLQGRSLLQLPYMPRDGNASLQHSEFIPIEGLSATDADIYLTFLNGNFAMSPQVIDDPWYASHQLARETTNQRPGGADKIAFYASDEEASPMACKTQFRTCQSDTTGSQVCSPFEGIVDAYFNQVRSESKHSELLLWLFEAFAAHTPGEIPTTLGASSLILGAGDGAYVQSMIPNDQWQQDVVFWHQQFLATLQGSMIDSALGFQFLLDDGAWKLAESPTEKRFCQNQKIRSPAHVNFSVLWLSLIFGIGGFLIVIQWILEPLISWIDHRRKCQSYKLLEWKSYETLQLQRMAHEEMGYGSWSKCTDAVPLPKEDDDLARIDMQDMVHPRLEAKMRSYTMLSEATAVAYSPDESKSDAVSSPSCGAVSSSQGTNEVQDDQLRYDQDHLGETLSLSSPEAQVVKLASQSGPMSAS